MTQDSEYKNVPCIEISEEQKIFVQAANNYFKTIIKDDEWYTYTLKFRIRDNSILCAQECLTFGLSTEEFKV